MGGQLNTDRVAIVAVTDLILYTGHRSFAPPVNKVREALVQWWLKCFHPLGVVALIVVFSIFAMMLKELFIRLHTLKKVYDCVAITVLLYYLKYKSFSTKPYIC